MPITGSSVFAGNVGIKEPVTIAVLISDTVERVPRADASTHAMRFIDQSHHEIHAGDHFFVKDYVDLASGANLQHLLVPPDTAEFSHFLFDFWHELEITFRITEGVTVDANGTGVPGFNNNRNSAHTPTMGVFHTPTNPAGGTVIWDYSRGTAQKGGAEWRVEHEMILHRGMLYLIQATNTTQQDCLYDFHFVWYEHTNKD